MTEDQMDKLIKNAAEHYNVPPVHPPLEQMWAAIETEAFGRQPVLRSDRDEWKQKTMRTLVNNSWLRMAAVLVLGVAIGRVSQKAPVTVLPFNQAAPATVPDASASYQMSAEQYLGRTVTLLASLPGQLQSGNVDSAFVDKASGSLTELRMLMDSPAASNPRNRALFDDLELVLVQIVQMPAGGNTIDAKLIRQAMRERDVMPRLVDAVAETPNF